MSIAPRGPGGLTRLSLGLGNALPCYLQTGLVKSKFVEAIQNYQTVEQQHRQKYKQRLERQYKIVKPDATPEEIRAVVEDDNGGQVFSQAVRIYIHSHPCTRRGRLIVIALMRFFAADEL